jgi:site-specific recombinase XerC
MIRLALAVRDADGDRLIQPAALEDLPHLRDTVAEIAGRAALLAAVSAGDLERRRPRFGPSPRHQDGQRAQSCLYCYDWGAEPVCRDCLTWARRRKGTCSGCHRAEVPLRRRTCRACTLWASVAGSRERASTWVQLALHGQWTRKPRRLAGLDARVHPYAADGFSEHLLWPGQLILAEAQRDWRPAFALDVPPALTPAAAIVLARFEREALGQQWTHNTRFVTCQAMRVLLSWLGTAVPIAEADVRALADARRYVMVRRILYFLSSYGLLDPDPVRQQDWMQRAVARRIGEFPGPAAAELERWVTVLRGQGRREHRAVSYRTIYNYLSYAAPVLHEWQDKVTSLRQVTHDDVLAAVSTRQGEDAHHLMVALRSIFRALKQERLIFANPCSGISVARPGALPACLPSDRLAGLLDLMADPLGRLAVALVAMHALRPGELRGIKLADLDLSRARLAVRRSTRVHTAYLDTLTLGFLDVWLRERRDRWSRTPNPHLLITQQTATDIVPVSDTFLRHCFAAVQITATRLREDRIMDEARHTADPVHLMRLFGISDTTAMKYVYAAHPDRQTVLPGR